MGGERGVKEGVNLRKGAGAIRDIEGIEKVKIQVMIC